MPKRKNFRGRKNPKGKRRRRNVKAMPVRVVGRRRVRGTDRRKHGIVPDRKFVYMRYYFEMNMDIAVNPRIHQFSGNSIHDPDETGIGHQPMGHDQWDDLYGKYVVYSATMHLRAFSVENSHPFIIGVRSRDDGDATGTGGQSLVELPGATFRIGPAYREKHHKITHKIDNAKWLNRKRLYAETDLVANMGATPSKETFLEVVAEKVSGETSGQDIRVVGWITYKVMLLDPLSQLAS